MQKVLLCTWMERYPPCRNDAASNSTAMLPAHLHRTTITVCTAKQLASGHFGSLCPIPIRTMVSDTLCRKNAKPLSAKRSRTGAHQTAYDEAGPCALLVGCGEWPRKPRMFTYARSGSSS